MSRSPRRSIFQIDPKSKGLARNTENSSAATRGRPRVESPMYHLANTGESVQEAGGGSVKKMEMENISNTALLRNLTENKHEIYHSYHLNDYII